MERVALVMDGETIINRIMLDDTEDPANWNAVWDTTPVIEKEPEITLEELILALEEDNSLPASMQDRVDNLRAKGQM